MCDGRRLEHNVEINELLACRILFVVLSGPGDREGNGDATAPESRPVQP